MFKHFTWAKLLADVAFVGSIGATIGGEIGHTVGAAAILVAGIAKAVAAFVTTTKAGAATDATGTPINAQ